MVTITRGMKYCLEDTLITEYTEMYMRWWAVGSSCKFLLQMQVKRQQCVTWEQATRYRTH